MDLRRFGVSETFIVFPDVISCSNSKSSPCDSEDPKTRESGLAKGRCRRETREEDAKEKTACARAPENVPARARGA
jgi:hypothetical protein